MAFPITESITAGVTTGHAAHHIDMHKALNQGWHNAYNYGAVGDGTTDDTAELQAWIDATVTGSGIGWLPGGRYKISAPLVWKLPARYLGCGAFPFAPNLGGVSVIQAASGYADDLSESGSLHEGNGWAHGLIVDGIMFRGAPGWGVPTAGAPSTATTGGTLAAGTYSYRVTAITAIGETRGSLELLQTTTGATSTVTVNWTAPTQVTGGEGISPPTITGYNVYGRTRKDWKFLATVGSGTLTWVDTGSATPTIVMKDANTSGQARGAGIRIYGGEGTLVANCGFSELPSGGILLRHDFVATLSSTMTSGSTTLSTSAWTGANPQNGDVVQVEDERMTVTSGGGTQTMTVTRGSWGTTAVAHATTGVRVFWQQVADSAPMRMRNIVAYHNRYGVHFDHANGPHTLDGITGDDNSSMVAITANTTDANTSGQSLNITLIDPKLELSDGNGNWTGHNPPILINNGNRCQLKIFGGRFGDFDSQNQNYDKEVILITSGWHGFNSTHSASVTFEHVVAQGAYESLLLRDTVRGEIVHHPDEKIGWFGYNTHLWQRSEFANPDELARFYGPTNPVMQLRRNVSTSLTAAVSAAATTFPVASGVGITNGMTLRIHFETVTVTGGGGTTSLTVTRGGGAEAYPTGTWLSGAHDANILAGHGTPEGVVTAGIGSLFLRFDGGATTTLYVKTSGSGNTGWTAK